MQILKSRQILLNRIACLLVLVFLNRFLDVGYAQEKTTDFSDHQIEHFEKKIRPLLAKRCFKCHGPKVEEPGGGLRFSSRAALMAGGDTGPAIVPGDSAKSLLIDSINYGEVYQMPPDSKMPAEEIKLLTDWVNNNAAWPKVDDKHLNNHKQFDVQTLKNQHWCWTPPAKGVTPPQVKNRQWPLDPIDQFILSRNEKAGLTMARPADRQTWIRRVYFDLIGLPPTPAQVTAFLNDKSQDAFEKVVDELLASEHFGERWARHWMDLVRYAETCGHEFEYPIPHAYRYRDYLIRAFNLDLPYKQLIREHIAGDLVSPRKSLVDQTNESILATGFWFLHEATHAPVDVRLDEANHNDNRIDVMSKSFLGLTIACARCHDHKFDAISTKDYYSLVGFLQSSRRQLAMLDPQGKIASGTNKIRQIRSGISQKIRDQLQQSPGKPDEIKSFLLASADPKSASQKSASNSNRNSTLPVTTQVVNRNTRLIDQWKHERSIAMKDPYHPLWLLQKVTQDGKSFNRKILDDMGKQIDADREYRAKRMVKGKVSLPFLFEDFSGSDFGDWFVTGEAFGVRPTQKGHWNRSGEKISSYPAGFADSSQFSEKLHGVLRSPTFELQSNEIWYRIKAKNIQIRLIIDGYVMDVYNGLLFGDVSKNIDTKGEFQWVRQAGDIRRYKGERSHIEIIDQGGGYAVVDQVVFSNGKPPEAVSPAIRLIYPEVRDAGNLEEFVTKYANALSKHSLGMVSLKADALDATAKKSREMITVLEREIPNPILAQAMTDGSPEDEFVFIRGNHKTLGDHVPRRMPEAFDGKAPLDGTDSGSGRLELANRIANDANPLTARVAVNRLWHHLFGRGIVASTNNFGVLGQKPTHPELLDYLANEFTTDGWSVKRMIKRLVLTQTYRMSSEINPKAKSIDPDNLLLHRMSIRRLQAEAIRDAMLVVSGGFNPTVYGPSVPVHLTPFMQGRGRPGRSGPVDGGGRRSLYIEIRRNFLPPMLLAFDLPIPFNSVGRRNLSNVPAQALILMNDPFVTGQAGLWSKKLIKETADPKQRISTMYLQAFARKPVESELANAMEFLKLQGKEMNIEESAAINHPETWKDLCHVILNVKEFIYLK